MTITADDLCIPTTVEKPFSEDGWIFELKYDGFRLLVTHQSGDVHLLSREGTEYRAVFPELVAAVKELPDLVLDGELVMLDVNGKPAFDRLVRRSRLREQIVLEHAAKATPAAIAAFDLLEFEGRDVRSLLLLERKMVLEDMLDRSSQQRIFPTTYVVLDGVALFAAADQAGLEGIVAKRADSPYRGGRSRDWLKIKTTHGRTIDEQRASRNECSSV